MSSREFYQTGKGKRPSFQHYGFEEPLEGIARCLSVIEDVPETLVWGLRNPTHANEEQG